MKHRFSIIPLFGVCLLAFAAPLWAAQSTPDNPDADVTVVVTANKNATPIDQVASSVTVITADQIAATHQPYLVDVLGEIPGLVVTKTGGPGHQVDAYIRGGEDKDTLVLLDGVPLNDPITGGSYDLGNLTTGNIARIEILRGPQSTLYGSNAMAGVINIITKRGSGKPITDVELSGGRYDTAEGRISSSGSANGWNYSLSGSRYTTDGFPSAVGGNHNDAYANNTLSTRFGKQFNKAFSLDFIGRYVKGKTELPTWDFMADTAIDDPGAMLNSEQTSLRLEGRWRPGTGKWENLFGISSNQSNMVYIPGAVAGDADGSMVGKSFKVDWQTNYTADKHHLLTFGVQTEQDSGKIAEVFGTGPASFTDIIPTHHERMNGYFAQDQITLLQNWFATVGCRLDDFATFGTAVTYRLASSYHLSDNGPRVKATFGTGFNAPSLDELYDPSYGNPTLQPEKSTSWDLGAEQELSHGKTALSATYFHNDYDNLIRFATTNYQNVANATARGVELLTSFRPSKVLHFDFNYTYTYTVGFNGEPLARRPRQQYGATATYQCTPKLKLNVQGSVVGKRFDKEFDPTPVTLPSYAVFNVAASYAVTTKLGVFLRLDNVFNAHYQQIADYATAGQSLNGGLKYKF